MNDATKISVEKLLQPGSYFISSVKWLTSSKKKNVVKFDFRYSLINTPMFFKLANMLASKGLRLHYSGFESLDPKNMTITCW